MGMSLTLITACRAVPKSLPCLIENDLDEIRQLLLVGSQRVKDPP
jgi:hypothetical protein